MVVVIEEDCRQSHRRVQKSGKQRDAILPSYHHPQRTFYLSSDSLHIVHSSQVRRVNGMRILTWNINGIRTLPQYHPWNQHKTCEHILKELKADIICFQEMKTSRAALERHVALPGDQFDAFFSFPTSKRGGYSGVGVFSNTETSIPLKAEEGLTGLLNTSSSGSKSVNAQISDDSSRVSRPVGYPRAGDEGLVLLPFTPEVEGTDTPTFGLSKLTAQDEFVSLDAEGRSLVLDYGLFVLINLYCPNSDNGSSRHAYKMNFHNLLGERVRRLIEDEKREVIVVGDINICSAPIDHCEGNMSGNREAFYDPPAREWFKNWIDPEFGPMVDVVRQCWPERKGMYTCWNTKISARETNYGTRIDYILLSRGLLPWFKHGDIMPSVRGSDHCPVYIDLHEEITDSKGNVRKLRDEMHMSGEKREPPRLCARYWPEFSGKQQLLSSFFGKGNKDNTSSAVSSTLGSANTKAMIPEDMESNSLEPSPTPEDPSNSVSSTEMTMASELTTTTVTISYPPSGPSQRSELSAHSQPTTSKTSSTPPSSQPSAVSLAAAESSSSSATASAKRKQRHPDSNYPSISSASSKKVKTEKETPGTMKSKAKTKKQGQMKLSNFFSAGSQSDAQAAAGSKNKANERSRSTVSAASTSTPFGTQTSIDVDAPEDLIGGYRSKLGAFDDSLPNDVDPDFLLDASQQSPSSSATPSSTQTLTASQQSQSQSSNKNAQHSWSTLFMRVEPPRCHVHNEPARSFRVNKQGPNRGKEFYICSRPVGPGYDAGRDKRRREDVDPQYRCNFFKWASEVRNDAIAKGTKG